MFGRGNQIKDGGGSNCDGSQESIQKEEVKINLRMSENAIMNRINTYLPKLYMFHIELYVYICICTSNEVILLGLKILPLRTTRLSNKDPSIKHQKSPFQLLIKKLQDTPKKTKAIVLDCLAEIIRFKCQLLNTPHNPENLSSVFPEGLLLQGYIS